DRAAGPGARRGHRRRGDRGGALRTAARGPGVAGRDHPRRRHPLLHRRLTHERTSAHTMGIPDTLPRRYVALGDSFTEGVGDPDPARANGLRGWADRMAEELARLAGGDFAYANLAVRGRLLDQVLDEQLEAALALGPDLVTIYAGGNDLMRPSADIDGLIDRYEAALARLTGSGARVLVFTAYDAGWAPVFRRLRGRTAIYNELLRAAVDRTGATLVDYWRMPGFDDVRMWDTDRLHMSDLGHARMAAEVLDVLGVDH